MSVISQSCKARGGAKSRWPPYSGWNKRAVDFLGSVLHVWGSPVPPHPLLYLLKTWWAGLASLAPHSAALCKLKHGKLKLPLTLFSASVFGFFASVLCWYFAGLLDSHEGTLVHARMVTLSVLWGMMVENHSIILLTSPLFLLKPFIFVHVMELCLLTILRLHLSSCLA